MNFGRSYLRNLLLLVSLMILVLFSTPCNSADFRLELSPNLLDSRAVTSTLYIRLLNDTKKELVVPPFFGNIALLTFLVDSLGNYYPDQLQDLQDSSRTRFRIYPYKPASSIALVMKPGFRFNVKPLMNYFIVCLTRSSKGPGLVSTGIVSFSLSSNFEVKNHQKVNLDDLPEASLKSLISAINTSLKKASIEISKDSPIFH